MYIYNSLYKAIISIYNNYYTSIVLYAFIRREATSIDVRYICPSIIPVSSLYAYPSLGAPVLNSFGKKVTRQNKRLPTLDPKPLFFRPLCRHRWDRAGGWFQGSCWRWPTSPGSSWIFPRSPERLARVCVWEWERERERKREREREWGW